jgi:Ig-like domain from next to BRCA1 gene/PB1 domain
MVVCKCRYGDELRRFRLDSEAPTSSGYAILWHRIDVAFGWGGDSKKVKPSDLQLWYCDDEGDSVCMDSDDELAEALSLVDRTQPVLRVELKQRISVATALPVAASSQSAEKLSEKLETSSESLASSGGSSLLVNSVHKSKNNVDALASADVGSAPPLLLLSRDDRDSAAKKPERRKSSAVVGGTDLGPPPGFEMGHPADQAAAAAAAAAAFVASMDSHRAGKRIVVPQFPPPPHPMAAAGSYQPTPPLSFYQPPPPSSVSGGGQKKLADGGDVAPAPASSSRQQRGARYRASAASSSSSSRSYGNRYGSNRQRRHNANKQSSGSSSAWSRTTESGSATGDSDSSSSSSGRPRARKAWDARFVEHVGVQDWADMPPDTPFVKTWRFRNEGTQVWPPGTMIVYVSKKRAVQDQMGGPDHLALGTEVQPDQEIDVSVDLCSPTLAGSYVGFWRLRNCEGRKFGQRVWSRINVVSKSKSK